MDQERPQWVRALRAHPPAKILSCADAGAAGFLRQVRRQERGVRPLPVQPLPGLPSIFLGAVPVVAVELELVDERGRRYPGGAQLLGDDEPLALALAVCDALLAHRLPGWEAVARLVKSGAAKCRAQERQREGMLVLTRREFEGAGDE